MSETQADENKQIVKKFISIDNKHQIEISIIGNICWFSIIKFEFEYYKTFVLTLKDVVMFLKKNNIMYIKQYVFEEDVKFFNNSSVINIDTDQYVVTTNIVNFLDETMNVLGIKKM